MPGFDESYLGWLRKLVGNQRLITPATRAVIRDGKGRVLLVRRSDNGQWVMPAGSMELGESVMDCLRREVKEESGLDVLDAQVMAIYSESRFAFTNAYGGEHQMFVVVFLVEQWAGKLITQTDETTDARFFALNELPNLPPVYRETLDDLQRYTGSVIVK
ncbi:MAG TPA: NUDIX domain-containing protein [Ktedonobacterales bacterium]|jgi:ADP-ribose pyrophosphatase YjhB (NUDIX family)